MNPGAVKKAPSSRLMDIGIGIGLIAVYLVTGKFGLSLAFDFKSATLIWPPAGIFLAVFLLFGYRFWPTVFIGAFLVNITTQGSAVVCLAIALGNTLEALAGAYLINRFANGKKVFYKALDILKFVMLAAILAPIIAASIGVASLCFGKVEQWADYRIIWSIWWLGDMVGILILTPLVVLWANKNVWHHRTHRRLIESLILFGAVVLIAFAVFSGTIPYEVKDYPLTFVWIPFIIWSAFWLSQRQAITAVFAVSVLAIWGTMHGAGPFAKQQTGESLLLLQGFMSTVTVIALTLVAIILDHKKTEEALRQSEEKFRLIVETSSTGLVMVNKEGRILLVNSQMEKLFNYSRRELEGNYIHMLMPERFRNSQPKDVNSFFQTSVPKFIGVENDLYGLRKNQSEFPIEVGLNPIRMPEEICVMASIIDITERKHKEEELNRVNKSLTDKLKEVEQLNRVMMGREERILSLKEELEKWKPKTEIQKPT